MGSRKSQDKWWYLLALAILLLGVVIFVTALFEGSGPVVLGALVVLFVTILVAVFIVLRTLNRSVHDLLDNK